MQLNIPRETIRTFEGSVANHTNAEQQLRRSVMSCMLWEREFYEDGVSISTRIKNLIPKVHPAKVAEIARFAKNEMKLRHTPLWIVCCMAGVHTHKQFVSSLLFDIIQRPDELSEFLAMYWKDEKKPISAQIKKGLASAFTKFNAYSLAKWNKDGAIKLRDVLFLCHAKAKDAEQSELWKQLINNELPVPDTWEVALSSGADKKESWERLLGEKKLGALALLRNLRNMQEVNVDKNLIASSLQSIKVDKVLPFRFISAARFAPHLEPYLEEAMFKCIADKNKLKGKTNLLIDVSGSMGSPISSKSDMTRFDAACGLAVLARELCEEVEVYTFSQSLVGVPLRRGFALRDAILNSQPHSSTYLGAAVERLSNYDRLIVFTDEQSHDQVSKPKGKGYMINVASAKNGVGYGAWNHIDGFSEAVFDFICEVEK